MKLIITLVLGFVFVAHASAVSVRYQGETQGSHKWCWAATAKAMLSSVGRNLRVCHIVSRTFGKYDDYCCDRENEYGDYCNRGYAVQTALEKLGYTPEYRWLAVPQSEVIAELRAGRAVGMILKEGSESHSVTIVGATDNTLDIYDSARGHEFSVKRENIYQEMGKRWDATVFLKSQAYVSKPKPTYTPPQPYYQPQPRYQPRPQYRNSYPARREPFKGYSDYQREQKRAEDLLRRTENLLR